MRIGLIGFGSIGREVYRRICDDPELSFYVLTRSSIPDLPDAVTQLHELEPLIAEAPDLVVECAGHAAVQQYAPSILGAGIPMLIASLGALADADLSARIRAAADTGRSRLIFPSGAIGGLDVLRALAADSRPKVRYIGTKPPRAWEGSAAEKLTNLSRLQYPSTFFSGTGREAAKLFPKNANVVAALALAGAGFDELQVTLVADPRTTENTHRYHVTAPACQYDFEISNEPTPNNPRTSLTTVLSIVHNIRSFAYTNSASKDPK